MVQLILSRKLLGVLAQDIHFVLAFPCTEEGRSYKVESKECKTPEDKEPLVHK